MSSMVLPRMFVVEQELVSSRLQDVRGEVSRQLQGIDLSSRIRPGARIAVTAGSRGIANIADIIAAIVDEVKRCGGYPFIIPAMGSHGGATPEGQVEILRSYGITPENVGAPIVSSLEVDVLGHLDDGTPVYISRDANEADGIIVVNRVKPHTDFKDRIESGLVKMLVIGMGKQKGAESLHSFLADGYHRVMLEMGRLILEKAKIICGIAIVEDGYHQTSIVKAITPERIIEEEAELQKVAKAYMARIPFKEIDLLIIDEIGKEISGAGMDPNVTGRFFIPGECEPQAPRVKKIVVLNLTDETEGNATGLGMADLTTRRVFEKIDFDKTFVNTLTSGWVEASRIPTFLPNDRDTILMGLRIAGVRDYRKAKIVYIKNTLELSRLQISEALLEDVEMDPDLKGRIKVVSGPREMVFDILGNLAR
ncbi:MAG: lactate racemase domain-containing protein [Candidatus Bathyarchaeia archaeon]